MLSAFAKSSVATMFVMFFGNTLNAFEICWQLACHQMNKSFSSEKAKRTVTKQPSFPPVCPLFKLQLPSTVNYILLCCFFGGVVSKGMLEDRYLCGLESSLWSNV